MASHVRWASVSQLLFADVQTRVQKRSGYATIELHTRTTDMDPWLSVERFVVEIPAHDGIPERIERGLMRIRTPFQGEVRISLRIGSSRKRWPHPVEVGPPADEPVEVNKWLVRWLIAAQKRDRAAMLQMFEEASNVIRASGEFIEAAGAPRPRPPQAPSELARILATVADLASGLRGETSSESPPSAPCSEEVLFDAWAFVDVHVPAEDEEAVDLDALWGLSEPDASVDSELEDEPDSAGSAPGRGDA
ncbi:MAG: hypothetical protein H6737_11055 [Alphaproteobacteria bacterium]|nr:hypothetical protein [Alphaproteobacteria bacterium]